ncbi:DNA repair ATPase [Aurantivibrio infirmus]
MAQQEKPDISEANALVDNAVSEGGAYDIIRKRLVEQGKQLKQQANQLNQGRLEEFGSSDMSVLARVRVRTENNCIARDIVQVGPYLLFGFNVFIGLKKETKVDDVFALFALEEKGDDYEMEPVPRGGTFLADQSFVSDFDELYRYYKHTRLVELTINHGKLLAGFQIGERPEDVRVFRWSISADGKDVKYIDNRGERDIQLPPSFDFEWKVSQREDIVHGRHAHINVLDTVFVETLAGDLTIKIENNTEDGQGVYREPVEDDTQSLDDVEVQYAKVGGLILLKILPYREEQWRYLIFNSFNQKVLRIDAIGQSCVQLPEDHGVIFPGGYYLQTGEHKTFDGEAKGLKFKRHIRSPNGEDVLYVFYDPIAGVVALLAYNLINKSLQNPIIGHGYALSDEGNIVIFSAEPEPTRVHPMQIWQTPYLSDEVASKTIASQTFYGRIGNAELVRGVSDIFSVCRAIDNQSVSVRLYEELSQSPQKLFDAHFWLEEKEASAIADVLREIGDTAELVIDEFEKVESIRQQSAKTMAAAEAEQDEIIRAVRVNSGDTAEEFVTTLGRMRRQRGHLTTIKEYRYIDLARINVLEDQLHKEEEELSKKTVEFLSSESALDPYHEKIIRLDAEVAAVNTNAELQPLVETIETTSEGLDLLSELMGTLKVSDATVRTRIIDSISEVYSKLNKSKAEAKHKQKSLGSEEAIAQFGAQFKLFSQTITNALGLATTPDRCDEQLSRLLVQLEELESQFSDYEQFLDDIMDKREEIYESFEAHKQQLLDDQQRKAQAVADAADRILQSIEKRSLKFTKLDELNTYFASDALALKTRDFVEQLRQLDSAVKADEIESRFKAAREQAQRGLRDKTDIFEEGGKVIKLGPRHKFSVNTQELDLTLIPRKGELNVHLTGTDYYEIIDDPELSGLNKYWGMSLESETDDVYRSEYLASLILEDAAREKNDLSMELLHTAVLDDDKLLDVVKDYSAPRYKEGYEKGVHDHDTHLLLRTLLPAIQSADLLAFNPLSRGIAQIFWANTIKQVRNQKSDKKNNDERVSGAMLSYKTWPARAQSAQQMQSVFASAEAKLLLASEIEQSITQFLETNPINVSSLEIRTAAEYLVAELSRDRIEFIVSKYAVRLTEELKQSMDEVTWRRYQKALEEMLGWPAERWKLTHAWLHALVEDKKLAFLSRYIPEACAIINSEERLDKRNTEVDLELSVEGLLGDHPRINNRTLHFSLDEFLQRLEIHKHEVLPAYRRYIELRQEITRREKKALRLESFKARPLSSFVRNKLINDAYLPIIGDNLAKQMGTMGDEKRTDLMGLLMMISPPGYGKTTLMEYVASRLGLVFMKINCPSLGHDVLSLDPAQAPNATARQELEKLNLGLEMGNNVMLYLDDIQHTHPEFLQKFISLCDGTRRVEGVWKGETKTYDMRGRKFCVVMAGNPYTESGELFKIPDMLANRADIYNLGDVLGGMDEQFAMSYIENSMTSNSVLAPLATREMEDLYKLMKIAKGENVPTTDLSHQYSGAELNEIVGVLKKLFAVQDVVLKINQQYIASAAQNDKYRTEPPFKLQGSYRNMNKMAEKVSAVMNDAEMQQMINDHYLGEAQLLTTGAEDNLLKLAALRGTMTDEQSARWESIKKDFMRNKAMGGDDQDVGGKVVAQLVDMVSGFERLNSSLENASRSEAGGGSKDKLKNELNISSQTLADIEKLIKSAQSKVEVINQPVPGIDKLLSALTATMENSIYPLIKTMDKKFEIDLRTHDKMQDVSDQLRLLESSFATVNSQADKNKKQTTAKQSTRKSTKKNSPNKEK